jgi:hypothetical protein
MYQKAWHQIISNAVPLIETFGPVNFMLATPSVISMPSCLISIFKLPYSMVTPPTIGVSSKVRVQLFVFNTFFLSAKGENETGAELLSFQ